MCVNAEHDGVSERMSHVSQWSSDYFSIYYIFMNSPATILHFSFHEFLLININQWFFMSCRQQVFYDHKYNLMNLQLIYKI